MSIILDLAIVGIILLCGWRGFRAGLINGVCGLLAVAIAIYGGSLVARVYSGKFTGMLEPFVSGVVDSAMSSVLTWQEGDKPEDKPAMLLTAAQREDVATVSHAVYYELGFAEEVSRTLGAETEEAVESVMNQNVSADINQRACARLAYMAAFFITFALIAIVFSAIGNILDLSFGLPGIENVNHIIGAGLGVIKGVAIVLTLACAFRYLGLIVPREKIEATWFLKNFVETNFIANILGI